jgi:hypothetical protein
MLFNNYYRFSISNEHKINNTGYVTAQASLSKGYPGLKLMPLLRKFYFASFNSSRMTFRNVSSKDSVSD